MWSANTNSSVVLHIMDRALKVLLLATPILLVSAQTWSNYRSLSDVVRKYIDKTLENANQKFGRNYHVAFHSLEGNPHTMESNLYVNARLIVTTCKKTSSNTYEHRDECTERNKKMPIIIDCLVCKKKDGEELVDCARLIDVKNGKNKEIRDKCNEYHTGRGSLMQISSGYEEKQTGCLGCV